MAALWMILALLSPTTTYHFAPLAVALAWPAYTHFGVVRARWLPGLMAAGGAAVLVALATAVLAGSDALRGPTLLGTDALAESAITGVAGLLIAVALARPRRP